MKAEKAIERAEHALRTNQPNLAQTYMREALRDLEARDRARRPTHHFFVDLDKGMQEVGKAFGRMADAMVEAFKPLTDLFAFTVDPGRASSLEEIEIAAARAQAARAGGITYGPEFFNRRK